MSEDHTHSVEDVVEHEKSRNMEAQSAFASTLVTDFEKANPSQVARHGARQKNLFGLPVDTSAVAAGTDAVYAAKAQLLNEALLDIGMGFYQWALFLTTCMGWFLDSFWMVSFIIIAPSAANEAQFFYTYNMKDYLYISQFVGLAAGALSWPLMADSMGRKWIFTSTLALMGVAGLVGAGMPAFTGLCIVGFVVGLAVAGNQAVDAIVLLESIPASHQYLVAMQGAFWGLGELIAYAVGWAFIALYTCGTGPDEESTSSSFSHSKRQQSTSSSGSSSCHYVTNKGWRYVWWTFGCITLFLYLVRFSFRMRETPKYLLAKGRDAEAIQVVRDVAAFNRRQTWLTESSFARIDSTMFATMSSTTRIPTTRAVLSAVKPLGIALLALLWTVAGLTFPLYHVYIKNYLTTKGVTAVTADTVTRDYLFSRYVYIAICAIPGPLVAGFLIEAKGVGRKRAGVGVAVITGLFIFLSTLSRSRGAWLAFECIISFLQFAGLAILTTYTVEIFPAPIRGTGVGIMNFVWRVFGLIAMVIITFDGTSNADGAAVWFCGAVWILVAGAWLGLSTETMGKAAA